MFVLRHMHSVPASEPENLSKDSTDDERNIRERQQVYNKAMYVVFNFNLLLMTFILYSAKAKLERINENSEKGKKKVALDPLTEKTVYFEDFGREHVPPVWVALLQYQTHLVFFNVYL